MSLCSDSPQVGEVVRGIDKTLGFLGFDSFFKAPAPQKALPPPPSRACPLSPYEIIRNKCLLMRAQSAPVPLAEHKRLHGESCGRGGVW